MRTHEPVTRSEDQPVTVYASESILASKAGREIAKELESRGMNVERQGTITLSSGEQSVTMTDEQFRKGTAAVLGNLLAEIPGNDQFEEHGVDFLEAPELGELAGDLIERYEELDHLTTTSIGYAWKAKGGESSGKAVFGKCVKASGLVKHFSEHQFVIWLAADNCREWGFTQRQVEALLFHELCHAGEKESKDGEIKATLIGHDVEAFAAEIERYGLWQDDLVRIKPVFDQCALPGFMQE